MQEAIHTAKEIDQKNKLAGFNQAALDQMAWQGYGNAQFEVDGEEDLDVVDEFDTDESKLDQQKTHDLTHAKDIQKGLQQSVKVLN
nr:hypothetical protein [uncultured Acinetobacter sp.]